MIEYTVNVSEDGNKEWYLNGKLHRVNGPAIEYTSGTKSWYLNGERHREDGPAIEYASGNKAWFLNGKLHREDGPAKEWSNGDKVWFLNDKKYSEEEFNEKLNPIKELSVTEIEELLGYKVKVIK